MSLMRDPQRSMSGSCQKKPRKVQPARPPESPRTKADAIRTQLPLIVPVENLRSNARVHPTLQRRAERANRSRDVIAGLLPPFDQSSNIGTNGLDAVVDHLEPPPLPSCRCAHLHAHRFDSCSEAINRGCTRRSRDFHQRRECEVECLAWSHAHSIGCRLQ